MKLDVSQQDEITMKELVEDAQTTNNSQKTSIANKFSNPFSCKLTFNNDEQQKPPPFVRDVQIPKLPIEGNNFFGFFLSSMEKLFMKGRKDYQGKACKSNLSIVKLVFRPRSYKDFFLESRK